MVTRQAVGSLLLLLIGAAALIVAGGCQSIDDKLDTPITANFAATPLPDAVRELSRQSGVPIELDKSVVVDKVEPVGLRLENMRCRDALAWIVRIIGPWYLKHTYGDTFQMARMGAIVYTVERDRVIILSGEEFLRRHPRDVGAVVRTYDVRDLCAKPEWEAKLVEFITTVIAPGTWGEGYRTSIRLRDGQLTVEHHQHVQDEVKTLLDTLRKP